MNNEQKILEKLDSHSELLKKQGESLQNITISLLDFRKDLGQRIETIESKMVTRDEFLYANDKIAKKLLNLEEGQKASIARDDRIESRIDLMQDELRDFRSDFDLSMEKTVFILQGFDDKQDKIESTVKEHGRILGKVKTQLNIV